MVKNGLKPISKDHRDRSFPRTFGTVNNFAAELNLDVFGFPDQNLEGYPDGCTGYAQTEICQDEDKAEYQPSFTYLKTLFMEGNVGKQVGCDIRDSLKSTIVYGVLGKDETDDAQATYHRRGAYYAVVDSPDLDAFDDVRSAIVLNNRTVSVGTPWFPEFETVGQDGVLPLFASPVTIFHNWKVCGWKQINGQPYLIGKTWQGPSYGDHGYCYLSRTLFNELMSLSGSGAFTVRKAASSDYLLVKLDILTTVVSYLRMWLNQLA